MTERMLNNGKVVWRREVVVSDSVSDVMEQIRDMAEGLEEPTVEFERDPCPYGGFDDVYISVYGKRPQKAAEG